MSDAAQTGASSPDPSPRASVSAPRAGALAGELRRNRVFSALFAKPAQPVRVGRFTLIESVGSGGMGELYAAYDPNLDRKVALKLLRPDSRAGELGEQRLLREAQTAARLSHPNVVQVYEAGSVEGRVFIAMEFVHGRTLSEWLAEQPSEAELDNDRKVLARFVEAGRGLAAVHAAGLAHRDFKPANVLVGDDERVRIVDFGLARSVDDRLDPLDPSSTSGSGERPVPTPTPASASTPSPSPEPELADPESTRTIEPIPTESLDADGRPSAPEDSPSQEPVVEPSASASWHTEAIVPGRLETLTIPGTIMGTPRYMAPEQWLGERGDARSDQFSFCVATYAALYGVHPFAGDERHALLAAIREQKITAPTREPKLPRSVREALLRGLEADPDARWPSMDALLEQLEAPLRPPSTRGRAITLALLLALLLGLLAATLLGDESDSPCKVDASLLAGSWDDDARAHLREAFAATGLTGAGESAATVVDSLDAWTRGWLEVRRTSCQATRVEGTQSSERLDLRTACLDRKRRGFEALVAVYAAADRQVVAHADELLAELPTLGECSNPRALAGQVPLPADPDDAAAVLRAYEALGRSSARFVIGEVEQARALAESAEAEAEALDYTPLRLAAHGQLAALIQPRDLHAALQRYRAAAAEAEREGLLELEANLRTTMASAAAGRWSKPELEDWLIEDAELALARLDQLDDPRATDLLVARATRLRQSGDYLEARAGFERAAELYAARGQLDQLSDVRSNIAAVERLLGDYARAEAIYLELLDQARARWGPRSMRYAAAEFNLGVLALDRGDFEGATRWLTRARDTYDAQLGPGTTYAAEAEFVLAKLAMSSANFDEARERLEALLPVFETKLGPRHESTARAQAALGVIRFYTGDYAGSIDAYERALISLELTLGPDNDEVGLMHGNIGESLLALGRNQEAIAAFDRALEILERALPADHPYLGVPLKGRGMAALATGDPQSAIHDLERALALLTKVGDEPIELADARFALARATFARDPGHPQIAREHAARAREEFADLGMDDREAAVREWLEAKG
ncbi:tetratricopeptide repeat protein [Pseudenhygromyxa sp. WMMC2535]|uniref:serine/threonine-protein kinase n=1 Tax=Pseudenhygromyxa sp. WMMC2535 TaxID=2712867 RepID=UPI0015533388|nr:serine/threonine-protein kinase [Pseudenhygromyxa sp. WMMC2535]NVB43252.1 tetratricopeptide repeat protein [Pseudenhygromyxa sp. WMMC2535]